MLLLFDISESQIVRNYELLKERTSGGFIKATGGISIVDKRFPTHWENTKNVGLPRGAYHFWAPGDPKKQAELFFNTVNGTGDLGELPPTLDIEPAEFWTADDFKILTEEVERLFGRLPMIYTSKVFFDKLTGGKSWASKYPLWVAHYITWQTSTKLLNWEEDLITNRVIPRITSRRPAMPSVWDDWQIWQFTDDGVGPDWGTDKVRSKQIDLSYFRGTLEEMLALGGTTVDQLREVTVPVENQMEWITTQLEKLVAAGITPAVEINIEGTLFDVEKLKSLKETLEKGGITPEVNLSIDMSSNGNTSPRTKTPIDKSQTNQKTPPDRQSPSPINHESFQVRAKAMKKNKNFIPLYVIQKGKKWTDNKGKPIMVKYSPVIRIPNGETFSVSSTHKVGSKDKGDGKVIGTGDEHYYLITDYSANDKAIGKYVMKDDVKVKR